MQPKQAQAIQCLRARGYRVTSPAQQEAEAVEVLRGAGYRVTLPSYRDQAIRTLLKQGYHLTAPKGRR